jgi:hypothetical protein
LNGLGIPVANISDCDIFAIADHSQLKRPALGPFDTWTLRRFAARGAMR